MKSFVVSLVLVCLLATPAFAYRVDAVRLDSVKVSSSISADTVRLAGGAKPLGNSLAITKVYIVPSRDNNSEVWIGTSAVDAKKGFLLVSGSNVSIDTDNLSNIWVTANSATTTNWVSFISINQ